MFTLNMSFYLKPPRGRIALHALRKCVHQRLQYLISLVNKDENYQPENFEYLIAGVAMDRAGHYMLRLLLLSSSHLRHFIIQAEKKFFLQRLEAFSSKEIQSSLRTASKHIDEIIFMSTYSEKFRQFLLNFQQVCKKFMTPKVADHTFNKQHSLSCQEHIMLVPFIMCLSLVRKRRVPLNAGKAKVPCGEWKSLLTALFELHIIHGVEQLEKSGCFLEAIEDPRIKELIQELEIKFSNEQSASASEVLRACAVDIQAKDFPLCMANLHNVLRARHRLTHDTRRHYSLFLKDIGMPVEEAVNFWSEEYSKPNREHCGGCSHSWQKDARRYQYSIRHMYGLEGGRYNYSVPSCRSIQTAFLQPASEGGCPFTHFDENKLISCFHPEVRSNVSAVNTILQFKRQSSQMACHAYHSTYRNISHRKDSEVNGLKDEVSEKDLSELSVKFSNPAQYYFSLKS